MLLSHDAAKVDAIEEHMQVLRHHGLHRHGPKAPGASIGMGRRRLVPPSVWAEGAWCLHRHGPKASDGVVSGPMLVKRLESDRRPWGQHGAEGAMPGRPHATKPWSLHTLARWIGLRIVVRPSEETSLN